MATPSGAAHTPRPTSPLFSSSSRLGFHPPPLAFSPTMVASISSPPASSYLLSRYPPWRAPCRRSPGFNEAAIWSLGVADQGLLAAQLHVACRLWRRQVKPSSAFLSHTFYVHCFLGCPVFFLVQLLKHARAHLQPPRSLTYPYSPLCCDVVAATAPTLTPPSINIHRHLAVLPRPPRRADSLSTSFIAIVSLLPCLPRPATHPEIYGLDDWN